MYEQEKHERNTYSATKVWFQGDEHHAVVDPKDRIVALTGLVGLSTEDDVDNHEMADLMANYLNALEENKDAMHLSITEQKYVPVREMHYRHIINAIRWNINANNVAPQELVFELVRRALE